MVDGCTIAFGGSNFANIHLEEGTQAQITNNVITDSSAYGVYCECVTSNCCAAYPGTISGNSYARNVSGDTN